MTLFCETSFWIFMENYWPFNWYLQANVSRNYASATYCMLYSGRSSSANCYMRLVRGAVLSPTVTGSASTHSCSEVNAVDFARRTCRGSTNYLKTPTLLCFIKSSVTVVMSCISFRRHFRRPHRTIVCVIELISSACRTTQDALWIVTFL